MNYFTQKDFLLLIFLLSLSSILHAQTAYQFRAIRDVEINGKWTIGGYGPGLEGNAICFVDIDHDGDPDMFRGGQNGKILFYRNDGSADTINWVLVTDFYGDIQMPFGLAVPFFADVTGDGLEDLFVGHGANAGNGGHVAFYKNIGTPDSAAWQLINSKVAGIDMHDRSVPYLADPDFDGDMDLFVGGGLGHVGYFENTGTPTQPEWDSVSTAFLNLDVGWLAAPAVVDIDQDSMLDVFIASSYGGLRHFEDVHPHPDTVDFQQLSISYLSWDPCRRTSGCGVRPAFVDIDHDSDLDLFMTGEGLRFFENTGTAQIPEWKYKLPNYPVIGDRASVAMLVDLNADSLPDLLHSWDNGFQYYANTGSIHQPAWTYIPDTFTSVFILRLTEAAFFDIDRDGDLDMVAGTSNGRLKSFINQGNAVLPHFVEIQDAELDIFNHGSHVYPYLTDLFKDDTLDLLISSSTQYYHYVNVSTSSQAQWQLRSTSFLPLPVNVPFYRRVSYGDIDQDGDTDIFLDRGVYRNLGSDSMPTWEFERSSFIHEGTPVFTSISAVELIPNCGIESMINTNGSFQLFTFGGIQPSITRPLPNFLCSDAGVYQFEAFPPKGEWSGDIEPDGTFDQRNGVGSYVGYYSFTDSLGCGTWSDTISFFVRQGPETLTFTANGDTIGDTLILQTNALLQQLQSTTPASGNWGGIADGWGRFEPDTLEKAPIDTVYWITYTRFKNGCWRTDSIPVKFTGPDGIEDELGLKLFVITPNPANEQIRVELDFDHPQNLQLLLVDYTGKMVFQGKSEKGIHTAWTIPIKHLPAGLYSISVKSTKGFISRKFMIYH